MERTTLAEIGDMTLSEFIATMKRLAVEHPDMAIGLDGDTGNIVGDVTA